MRARVRWRWNAAEDDFFADRQRMLNPEPAVFVPGKYDANGKWMDGWESRRKRGPGHDWCVVKLARPGRIHGLDLDTSHFTGNYPPAASVEAVPRRNGRSGRQHDLAPAAAQRQPARQQSPLLRDRQRRARLAPAREPVPGWRPARLRVYGTPEFPVAPDADGLIDLCAALNGGTVVAANNQHFGLASTLLLPGRGLNMGDGWETRRRREPGVFIWCVIALARPGVIEAIEVDTAHFKGNYPDRFRCAARGWWAVRPNRW